MSENTRLDVRLHELYPDVSRAQLQRFIDAGDVKVNRTVQTKFGFMVKQTDKVSLSRSAFDVPTIPEIDIPVIYEDKDVVVIDKPVGLLSHSKGAFNPEATVATWLSDYLSKKGPKPLHLSAEGILSLSSAMSRTKSTVSAQQRGKIGSAPKDQQSSELSSEAGGSVQRFGIVHRLDRGTSGVMICAKNDETRLWLQKQFSTRKVKKAYIARIEGTVKHPEANIDLPIERNPKSPQRFRVGQNGKSAQTYYKVLQTLDNDDSIVELQPLTGRTHQLRVHLKYMGHPIIGDTFYDGREADRLYLHAHSLELTLPDRTRKTFTSEVPKEFYKKQA